MYNQFESIKLVVSVFLGAMTLRRVANISSLVRLRNQSITLLSCQCSSSTACFFPSSMTGRSVNDVFGMMSCEKTWLVSLLVVTESTHVGVLIHTHSRSREVLDRIC